MAEKDDKKVRGWAEKGYSPDKGIVRNGYIPETNEAGPPPRGGSGSSGSKGGDEKKS